MDTVAYLPEKIVSGGQTGADRAALDFAIAAGIPHGGFCPKGRKAEDGRIPDRYQMTETESPNYPPRTDMNVAQSDATAIFTYGPVEEESGCALTLKCCRRREKPHMVCDLKVAPFEHVAIMLRGLVKGSNVKVLNVAGSRESKCPGIHDRVQRVLELAFYQG